MPTRRFADPPFLMSLFSPRSAVLRRAHAGASAAFFAALLLSASSAWASQIVVLDMTPSSPAQKALASTLSPVFVTQLSRVEGMSVISQADVRALMDLEANKAAMGCDEVSCMTEVAGSLGAELLVSSTVGKVGKKVVITATMLDVVNAKVIRRAQATATSSNAAPDAVSQAVGQLFGRGLPQDLQGPASMSRLGFRAALAGLRQSILLPGSDPQGSRRRVVLDLVNTELDYDAKPKLDALDLEIRRGWSRAEELAIGATKPELAAHYIRGMEYYSALRHDHGRVVEIRTRARERGVVPSATPLRFQDPEPYDRPDPKKWAAYWKASKKPRQVVSAALKAYQKNKRSAFLKHYPSDKKAAGTREWTSSKMTDLNQKYSYRVMPEYAYTPQIRQRAVDSNKSAALTVFVVRFDKKGEPDDERAVRLKKIDGRWVLDDWL